MSDLGFWLIRLTIWLAVSMWLLRVGQELIGSCGQSTWRMIRFTWLLGACACALHVVAAMGFGHCWSLGNAMRHTGMVTRQVTGFEFPESVFINFVFVLYWLFDGIVTFQRPQASDMGPIRHCIWAVMMVNATVIFGPRYWTGIGVVSVLAGVGLLCFRMLRRAN